MNYMNKNQQGYTLITLIFIFCIIVFFILLGLKILPIYINHNKVVNALALVKETEGVENKSTRKIRNIIDGHFNLNYIEHLEAVDVQIYNRPDYLKLELDYEVLEPMIGNLSILVEFHEELEFTPKDDN